jgi:hypothetical protein
MEKFQKENSEIYCDKQDNQEKQDKQDKKADKTIQNML